MQISLENGSNKLWYGNIHEIETENVGLDTETIFIDYKIILEYLDILDLNCHT